VSAIHLQSDDVHSLSQQHKGRLTGQKPPLKPKDVWAIRILLQIHGKTRDLALFNLAIDSKLRSCDLVALRVWGMQRCLQKGGYLFPSRVHTCPHLSTRQYARIVNQWVESIGLDPYKYGTHSLRRTKAALIYKKTGNLRAVQLLLGYAKLESTVRYLGIEVDD